MQWKWYLPSVSDMKWPRWPFAAAPWLYCLEQSGPKPSNSNRAAGCLDNRFFPSILIVKLKQRSSHGLFSSFLLCVGFCSTGLTQFLLLRSLHTSPTLGHLASQGVMEPGLLGVSHSCPCSERSKYLCGSFLLRYRRFNLHRPYMCQDVADPRAVLHPPLVFI